METKGENAEPEKSGRVQPAARAVQGEKKCVNSRIWEQTVARRGGRLSVLTPRMTSLPNVQHSSPRRIAPLLAALSAVGPFSVDAYLPAMGQIGATLHASPLAVQQTLTAYMVPFALMTLWHGSISDAMGRRRV